MITTTCKCDNCGAVFDLCDGGRVCEHCGINLCCLCSLFHKCHTVKLKDCDIVFNSNVGFVCYVNHSGNPYKIYETAKGYGYIKIKGKRFYITINGICATMQELTFLS